MKKSHVRVIVFALVAIMAFTSAACANTPAPTPAAPAAADNNAPAPAPAQAENNAAAPAESASGPVEQTGTGKTVGVASLHLVNDWNTFATEEVKSYLEARGYTVIHTNAMDSTSQMVKDVENLIEKKVDGIIIAGGEAHAFMDLSITAKNAGIKVIGMDMYLPGASCGVAADNYTGGTQIGQFMVNKMQGEGKYIVLNSPGWQSLTIRRRMALAVFEDFPGMQLVGEYEVATDPLQTSSDFVKAAVQNHPDLKGVLCTWGLPGIGAANAVQELGLQDQICVVSADSDREVMEKMSESDAPMMANIGQDPRKNGSYAAEMMDRAISQGDEDMATMYFAPTLMVSNDDYARDFPEIVRINMRDLWDRVYVEYERTFD